MSRKASGTQHPAVLFLMSPESGAKFPSIHRTGENHEVLMVKSGELEMSIVIVGKAEE
jgi:hypothetical protein